MEQPAKKPNLLTRIYRKHVAANLKEMEYGFRGLEDLFAATKELETRSLLTATVIPVLDQGILALRAAWEKKRFADLQSERGSKTVQKQEEKIYRAEQDYADEETRTSLIWETFTYKVDEGVTEINEMLASSSDLESFVIRESSRATPEGLMSRLAALQTILVSEVKKHDAAIKESSTSTEERGQHLEYREYLLNTSERIGKLYKDITETIERLEKSKRDKKAAAASFTKASSSPNLPEVRLAEHERLEVQREKFSAILHRVQIRRLVMQRKMGELENEIHELKEARDPFSLRQKREFDGTRMVKAELGFLLNQAQKFADPNTLRKELEGDESGNIEKKTSIEAIGRRPRVHDVEKIVLGASMQEETRVRLLTVLYGPEHPLNLGKVADVSPVVRYGFVEPSTLMDMVDELKNIPLEYFPHMEPDPTKSTQDQIAA